MIDERDGWVRLALIKCGNGLAREEVGIFNIFAGWHTSDVPPAFFAWMMRLPFVWTGISDSRWADHGRNRL